MNIIHKLSNSTLLSDIDLVYLDNKISISEYGRHFCKIICSLNNIYF